MIEAAAASDPGCIRTNNEDYFLIEPHLGLYIVADGMGGAQAGEHAAKLAADTVREVVAQADGKVDPRMLVSAFEEANRRVISEASRDPSLEGMGTTLVAALQWGNDVIVVSVGDSRAYVFEKGKLQAVTEDQTWVNEVGRRLGVEEDALKNHPMRHVLTMAVGVSESLRVHTYLVKPAPGTLLLLSSDGLHGVVGEEEMVHVLDSTEPLEAKCRHLIEAARAQGGPDNITAVLLRAS